MAVLILLFYMEDRWAYMISMLAPAAWLVMAFAAGMLGAAARQFAHIGQGATLSNLVSRVAVVTAILSLLMIAAAGRPWRREYAGLGKSLSTFAVSFSVVAVYYTILVVWFWHLIPAAAATRKNETNFPEASNQRLGGLGSLFQPRHLASGGKFGNPSE